MRISDWSSDVCSSDLKDRTEWHTVAIFSEGLVNVAERLLRKGSKVYVEGQLRTRKWQDQSGQDRYTTEVVLQGFDDNLVLLDGRDGGSGSAGGGNFGGGRSDDGWGASGGYDTGGSPEARRGGEEWVSTCR